jgi:hypothetical protein
MLEPVITEDRTTGIEGILTMGEGMPREAIGTKTMPMEIKPGSAQTTARISMLSKPPQTTCASNVVRLDTSGENVPRCFNANLVEFNRFEDDPEQHQEKPVDHVAQLCTEIDAMSDQEKASMLNQFGGSQDFSSA